MNVNKDLPSRQPIIVEEAHNFSSWDHDQVQAFYKNFFEDPSLIDDHLLLSYRAAEDGTFNSIPIVKGDTLLHIAVRAYENHQDVPKQINYLISKALSSSNNEGKDFLDAENSLWANPYHYPSEESVELLEICKSNFVTNLINNLSKKPFETLKEVFLKNIKLISREQSIQHDPPLHEFVKNLWQSRYPPSIGRRNLLQILNLFKEQILARTNAAKDCKQIFIAKNLNGHTFVELDEMCQKRKNSSTKPLTQEKIVLAINEALKPRVRPRKKMRAVIKEGNKELIDLTAPSSPENEENNTIILSRKRKRDDNSQKSLLTDFDHYLITSAIHQAQQELYKRQDEGVKLDPELFIKESIERINKTRKNDILNHASKHSPKASDEVVRKRRKTYRESEIKFLKSAEKSFRELVKQFSQETN